MCVGTRKKLQRKHLFWKCFGVCQAKKKIIFEFKMANTTWKTW